MIMLPWFGGMKYATISHCLFPVKLFSGNSRVETNQNVCIWAEASDKLQECLHIHQNSE